MRTKDICVIFNPHAGRGRAGRRLEKVRWHFRDTCEFWATSAPGEGEILAKKAAAAGFATVGAAGGDGTVHEVANGLLESGRPEVALAVFPIGSANDYAHSLGLDETWWAKGESKRRKVDAGRVRSADGKTRWFVNGLGLGFNCAVTLEARKLRWLQGVPLYAAALLRALCWGYSAPRARLMLDEFVREGPLLALSIGLGRREGNFLLTPHAELDDGWFDYLHVGPLPRWKLISYLPRIVTGRLPTRDPLVLGGRCRRVHVQSESSLAIHTDGEFFARPEDRVTSVEIELIPAALWVESR